MLSISLRDFFAATATDGDIQEIRDSMPMIDVRYSDGYRRERAFLSRQDARYMHADLMLKAHNKDATGGPREML